MPNWCLNEVRVYFPDKKTRDEFLTYCEGTRREVMNTGPNKEDVIDQEVHVTIEFNKIIPEPSDEEKVEHVGSVEDWDWYAWRIQHWGTKWEPDIISFDREDDETIYWEFYTAWGPPAGIYGKLMDDWVDKDVQISWFYREDGMQFAGFLPD